MQAVATGRFSLFGFEHGLVTLAVAFAIAAPISAQDVSSESWPVVVHVGAGSALDEAGLEPGDRLLRWKLESTEETPPHGKFEDYLDWPALYYEWRHRGTVELTVLRKGVETTLHVHQGTWTSAVQPRLPERLKQQFEEGRARLEEPDGDQVLSRLQEWLEGPALTEAHRTWLAIEVSKGWINRGDVDRAVKILEGALSEAADVRARMYLSWNLAWFSGNAGDWPKATAGLEEALASASELWGGESWAASDMHLRLGIAYRYQGDLARADAHYREAARIRERIVPGSLGLAEALNNVGNVALARGQIDVAAGYYRRALEIREGLSGHGRNTFSPRYGLARIAFERGELERARSYVRRALDDARVPGARANALVLQSSILSALGQPEAAEQSLEEAIAYYEGTPKERITLAAALTDLGELARQRDDLSRASSLHERALEIKQEEAPNSLDIAFSLVNLARLARARHEYERAEKLARRALEIRLRLAPGSFFEAEARHDLATILEASGSLPAARDQYLLALDSLEAQLRRLGSSNRIEATARSQHQGYYRDAIAVLLELGLEEEAFATLERSRAQSFLSLLAERDLLYTDLPPELSAARHQTAWQYDRIQSRIRRLGTDDREQLEQLEQQLRDVRAESEALEEKLRATAPRLAALQYPVPLKLAEAASALDPGTVLFAYSLDQDKSHLFVVDHQGRLTVARLDIGEDELERLVRQFVELIEGRRDLARVQALAATLYDVLVRPAEQRLQGAARLLLVPEGSLHLLPFAALYRHDESGDGGDYLLERLPVHSAPSATVYAQLRSRAKGSGAARDSGEVLAAFGGAVYPRELAEAGALEPRTDGELVLRAVAERGELGGLDFGALPYTKKEVERIVALFSTEEATAYLGAEASETRLKHLEGHPRILHVAAHGYYDDTVPLDSAIVLSVPDNVVEGQDNGLLQAWEILESVRLDADLVVLSSCRSGVGKALPGEGLMGLTRAFHFSGARTVVASLWNVADSLTSELMVRFYRSLRAGRPKDEALRDAQLSFLREPVRLVRDDGEMVEQDGSHPFFWAAFQVLGDPGVAGALGSP